jgi:hypothetical protein
VKKRSILLVLLVVAVVAAALLATGRHVASSSGHRVADVGPNWGWWDMR